MGNIFTIWRTSTRYKCLLAVLNPYHQELKKPVDPNTAKCTAQAKELLAQDAEVGFCAHAYIPVHSQTRDALTKQRVAKANEIAQDALRESTFIVSIRDRASPSTPRQGGMMAPSARTRTLLPKCPCPP